MKQKLLIQVISLISKKHKLKRIIKRLRFPFLSYKKKKLYKEVLNTKELEPLITTQEKPAIVVSLTSYPPRFRFVPLALKSLFLQNIRPNRIIVWHECDRKELTKEMLEYEKLGVEFIKVEEDLGPHKKYFYALQEMSDDIVVVVDDDLVYTHDMIESLMKTHEKYPESICSRRVHRIKLNDENKMANYDTWIGECFFELKPSHLLMATTGSGTLFPPNALGRKAFNDKLIKERCLYADDIWLKYIEILDDVKVVWAPNSMPLPPVVEDSQQISLGTSNVVDGGNDKYIELLNGEYGDEIAAAFKKVKNYYKKNSVMEWLKELLGEQIYCWRE